MVLAGEKPPYFVTCLDVPDVAGLDPVRADVECVPGIPMRLKLIDKETGKTPKGVEVSYWPIYPNAHVREVPGYAPVHGGGPYNEGILQDDGTYLLGVLPGPGAVTVRTAEASTGRPASIPGFLQGHGEEARPGWLYGDRNNLFFASGERRRRPAAIAVRRHRAGQPPGRFGTDRGRSRARARPPARGPRARPRRQAPGRRDRRGRGRRGRRRRPA